MTYSRLWRILDFLLVFVDIVIIVAAVNIVRPFVPFGIICCDRTLFHDSIMNLLHATSGSSTAINSGSSARRITIRKKTKQVSDAGLNSQLNLCGRESDLLTTDEIALYMRKMRFGFTNW